MTGRVVLVTGAAGGIGSAITRALIAAGHSVAAVDRDTSALARLPASDRTVLRCAAVLGARFEPGLLVQAVGAEVAAANDQGVWKRLGEFLTPEPSGAVRFRHALIRGHILVTQAALSHMRQARFGRIINNTTSFRSMLRVNPYGPLKAALEALSAVWAEELKNDGITVNVLIPGGPTDTPFISDDAGWDRAKMLSPEVMGPPACWVISDEAAGYTGNRIIAGNWDAKLPGGEAATKAGRAIGWPELGADAVWLSG